MPSSQEPNLGLNYKWALGESGWNTGNDQNLRKLGALVLLSVASASETSPPSGPVDGERYIVGSGSTGSWAGKDGNVAQYDASMPGWTFYQPSEGWHCRPADTYQLLTYQSSSSGWVPEGSLYGQYPDDSAAATGGVSVGEIYVNSTTGALTSRLT